MYFTKLFWQRAAERAIKSGAQAVVGVLTAGMVAGATGAPTQVNAFLTDWVTVAGAALGMAVLSLATSLATAKVGPADDPGVV